MQIAFGRNAKDNVPRQRELSFEQFVEVVKRAPVHHGSLSAVEYGLAGREERARDKDCGWFIPALFVRPERKATAVSRLDAFVLDFDDGEITRGHLESLGCAFVAWTSYSHTPEKEKWRVVIPYATPITDIKNGKSAQHQAIYEHFQAVFEGHLDPRCATVSQLWYLPGRPRDAASHEIFAVVDGPSFVLPTVAVHSGNASAGIGGVPPVRALATRKSLNADLSGRSPPSLRDIEKALNEIDPSGFGPTRYTEWTTLGFAVYEGTSGSREGYDIFDTWSRRIPGYEAAGITTEKWASFGGSREGPRITVATLFKLAAEATNVPHHADVAPGHHDAPASTVQPPAEASSVRHSPSPDSQPALPVLPLIVTAPVPMPAKWRNHPKEFAIQKEGEDPGGSGNPMWQTVIRGVHILRVEYLASIGAEQYSAEVHFQNAGKAPIVAFTGAESSDARALRGIFSQNGVVTTPDEFKHLQDLIMDWLKKIQDAQQVKQSFTHLGWMDARGKTFGFAHGDTAYFADGRVEHGIKVASGGGASIAKHYYPTGDLTKWKNISKFLAQQARPELMAILATAFGSPLMRFSGHSGAVVSIVSTASGVGKSTALSLAQSVWGNPKSAIHAAVDTVASLSSKMGFTKDLPAYWDDIKGENTFRQFAETIYQITQGKEKASLTQQRNLREVETWNCLAVIAANDSIIEIVKRYGRGTDAGAARIFELVLEDRPPMSQSATFFDACTSNYGRAGEVYSAWLATNASRAQAIVERLSESLSTELAAESEERFWLAAIATMIAGAMIAKQLQLVDFDVPALKAYLVTRFRELRGSKTAMVADQGPGPVISNMVLDYQATTLRIAELAKHKGGVNITHSPKAGAVDVLIIDKSSLLRIRKAKFNEWCRDHNNSPDTLLKRLQKENAVTERNTDPMGGASNYSQGTRTTCYDIDLKTLGVKGDVDGAT